MQRRKRPGVVPTSELPMVMLSWVDRWGHIDYGDRSVGYPERPPTPGLAEQHARAITRWDEDCAEPAALRHPERHRGPDTLYTPTFNGVLDPDPLDVALPTG